MTELVRAAWGEGHFGGEGQDRERGTVSAQQAHVAQEHFTYTQTIRCVISCGVILQSQHASVVWYAEEADTRTYARTSTP